MSFKLDPNKRLDWNEEKNKKLKKERGINFEDFKNELRDDCILDIINHPNPKKYPNQKIFIFKYQNYAYLAPFVEDKEKYFLKTIYPSRQAAKKYLKL